MIQLLLDTHTFLWFYEDSDRLSKLAEQHLVDPSVQMFLSLASVWEISIKIGLGKLALKTPLASMITYAEQDGFSLLPIKLAHVLYVQNLPRFADHRDPFDRLLVSQALVENFEILSGDSKLDMYQVRRIW